MSRALHTSRICGYVRLSRDDPDATTPLSERFALRIGILQSLARQHGHLLDEENIIVEQASGGSIRERPLFRALLERCEAGEISILYSPYQDRILRGDKADEQAIEDAFVLGGVTLITTEGTINFAADDYDPLPFEVRAFAARITRREYSKKRRETSRERTRKGLRSSGVHPYGFVWISPRYEGKQLVSPAHFQVVPEEYAVLEEVYRRIRTESLQSLARDLTDRYRRTGSPPPPNRSKERAAAGSVWHPITLRRLLENPLYAGYLTSHKKKKVKRGGGGMRLADVPRSEWVFSEEVQTFRHPDPPPGQEAHHWRLTTLAEQEEIAALLRQRGSQGGGRPGKVFILTGLLCCPQGRGMIGKREGYICECARLEGPHPTQYLALWKAHQVAFAALDAALNALPERLLQSRPAKTDRSALRAAYERNRRELVDCRENAHDLMENRRRHVANYGEADYDATCQRNADRLRALESEQQALQARLDAPDLDIALPLLARIRETGLMAAWQAWSGEEQRQVVRLVLARIEVVGRAEAHKHARSVRVVYQDWLKPVKGLPVSLTLPTRADETHLL
jgi:DNA invertase Pin-like site-specific DNA recombinase/predicted Fe-S protein YdhL (DUF1289 family)